MTKNERGTRPRKRAKIALSVASIAVAGGLLVVAYAWTNRGCHLDNRQTAARVIRSAAGQYGLVTHSNDCPTIEDLVHLELLDAEQRWVDPWGGAYVITCVADEIRVTSHGPDRKPGGGDDIQVPKFKARD